ncbi:uncharacterized protein A4U43_C05F26840 [Asparagus officinalis]|uniref:Uncharacterized protein n=1 Tax=Asparagus officinalis TaxID=4686 RepID=A0A5P1EX95_ASPOF|nr:uncharacterized protein A4U43_C05F26840 [Asparagus officinalis]
MGSKLKSEAIRYWCNFRPLFQGWSSLIIKNIKKKLNVLYSCNRNFIVVTMMVGAWFCILQNLQSGKGYVTIIPCMTVVSSWEMWLDQSDGVLFSILCCCIILDCKNLR